MTTLDLTTAYCTLDDLKHARGVDGLSMEDPEAEQAILSASRLIDEKTGRQFLPGAAHEVRQFWPQNSGYCIIDDLNTLDSFVAQDATWLLDRDFMLEPINAPAQGRPWTAIRTIARPFLFTKADLQPGGWAIFDGRVHVTGTYGWTAPPDPIVEATILLASRLVTRSRSAPLAVFGGGLDNPAVRLGRWDPDIEDLLAPYVISWIA